MGILLDGDSCTRAHTPPAACSNSCSLLELLQLRLQPTSCRAGSRGRSTLRSAACITATDRHFTSAQSYSDGLALLGVRNTAQGFCARPRYSTGEVHSLCLLILVSIASNAVWRMCNRVFLFILFPFAYSSGSHIAARATRERARERV